MKKFIFILFALTFLLTACLDIQDGLYSIKREWAKLWTKQWGTTSDDYGLSVAVDSSGNVFVTGYTDGGFDGNTNAGGWDIFLTKWNNAGVKQWTKQLGTTDDDDGNSVAVDGSGNVFVTGVTKGGLDGNTNSGDYDIFLTKFEGE